MALRAIHKYTACKQKVASPFALALPVNALQYGIDASYHIYISITLQHAPQAQIYR